MLDLYFDPERNEEKKCKKKINNTKVEQKAFLCEEPYRKNK